MARVIVLAAILAHPSFHMVSSATAEDTQERGVVYHPPREAKEGSIHNDYAGTVTMVSRDSITIQWTVTSGEKPKKFAASEALVAGKIPMIPRSRPGDRYAYKVMPQYMYRIADVKVGDEVGIIYARVNGVDICDHIRICRRPDGEVPPLPKEAEDLRDLRKQGKIPDITKRRYVPYHEAMNAYWAKVAPMPREVKPLTSK